MGSGLLLGFLRHHTRDLTAHLHNQVPGARSAVLAAQYPYVYHNLMGWLCIPKTQPPRFINKAYR